MFSFSSKEEYAVLAVLALSVSDDRKLLQVKEISKRERLSTRYLEQVMGLLKKEGLVESVRGPSGGYHLTRLPHEICLSDVLRAVGNRIVANPPTRQRKGRAQILQELSDQVGQGLKTVFDTIHFQSLCQRKKALEAAQALMYHI